MKKIIIILFFLITLFKLYSDSNYSNEEKDKQAIILYYSLLNKKNFKKAYELSPKKVSYDIFYNLYSDIQSLEISRIFILRENIYRIIITTISKNNAYDKYYVVINAVDGKIIETKSENIQHIENDNITIKNYKLYNDSKWSSSEFIVGTYDVVLGKKNVWYNSEITMVQFNGIYLINKEIITFKALCLDPKTNKEKIQWEVNYKITKDDNLLKSNFKLVDINDRYNIMYMNTTCLKNNMVRKLGKYEFFTINFNKYKLDKDLIIYEDPDNLNNIYEFTITRENESIIKTKKISEIKYVSVNNQIIGYKNFNSTKWYLINFCFLNYDLTVKFKINIFNKNEEINNYYIIGWIRSEDIKL